MARTRNPLVAAIVLNWNNYEDTARCLDSLEALSYDNLAVVVVDNGSTDGSGRRIERDYSDVTVCFNRKNEGFSGGVNSALRSDSFPDASFVWIVNNDTLYPEPEVLGELVDFLEEHPRFGAVTPVVTEYPNTDEIWFRHGFVERRSMRAGHNQESRKLLEFRLTTSELAESGGRGYLTNDYIPLCCALFRKETIDDVGEFCEDFFLYYEDVDYSLRATDSGYELATNLEVSVAHRVEGSSDGDELATYYNFRNRILLARHYRSTGILFWLLLCWYLLVHVTYYSATLNWARIRPLLLGFIHGVVGGEGRGPYP